MIMNLYATHKLYSYEFLCVFTEWNGKNNVRKKGNPDSNKFPRTMSKTRKNCSALQ